MLSATLRHIRLRCKVLPQESVGKHAPAVAAHMKRGGCTLFYPQCRSLLYCECGMTGMSMEDEEHLKKMELLLRENARLIKENNRLLRKMRRAQVWGLAARMVALLLVLGLPVLVYYYFLQPLLGDLAQTYGALREGAGALPGADEAGALLKGLLP